MNNENDWWVELSPSQKKNIELGLKDLNEGRTPSSQEFWSRLKNSS